MVPVPPGDRTETSPFGALVGREAELAELTALVRSDRLVTLTGPGGVGKSHLAHAAVDRLRATGRVAVVELDPLGDAVVVAEAAARAVIGERYGATDAVAALEAALGDGELLLLLDCFDHAFRETSDVLALLGRCPGLRILVTCQRRLGLRSERVLAVAPLAVPEPGADPWTSPAVVLLAELVRRAGRRVARAEGPHLAEISRRAAGVPLALALVAGWVAVYSPAQLAQRLAASLELFTGGGPDLPDRHRDLRTLIRWSTAQLTPGEREVLTAVALLPTGADGALLADLCSRRVDADLRALVERHLVHDTGRAAGPGEPWFDVLDPIRLHFADEHADEHADDTRALRDRLTGIVVERVKTLSPQIGFTGTADAIRRLTRLDALLLPTVESLAGRGDGSAVEVALDLVPYWASTARLDAGVRALTVAAGAATGDAAAARVLTARAGLLARLGDGQAAHDARYASERARRAGGDPSLVARADVALARALLAANRRAEAAALLERTATSLAHLDRATAVELATALAGARFNAGEVAGAAAMLAGTGDLLDGSVPLPLRLDAAALRLLVGMGQLDEARPVADVLPARALLSAVEWPMIEAVRLRYWGAQHLLQGGHVREAATLTATVVPEAEATGVAQWISSACTMRAAIVTLEGDTATARTLVARAVEVELATASLLSDLFGDLAEFGAAVGLSPEQVRHVVRTALRRPLPGDTWAIGITAPRGFERAVAASGLTPDEVAAERGRSMEVDALRAELHWLRDVLADPYQVPDLSARERDVVALVLQGLTDREIAGRLQVGVRTVNTHVASILRKSGSTNRRELIARHRRGSRTA